MPPVRTNNTKKLQRKLKQANFGLALVDCKHPANLLAQLLTELRAAVLERRVCGRRGGASCNSLFCQRRRGATITAAASAGSTWAPAAALPLPTLLARPLRLLRLCLLYLRLLRLRLRQRNPSRSCASLSTSSSRRCALQLKSLCAGPRLPPRLTLLL
jgi:hypothetical protein